MDRTIVYPSAIPLDSDLLNAQRSAMVALGMLMNGLYGSNMVAIGLPCTPTVPASMQVTVGQGGIVSMQTVDASGFGSLTADNSPLVKLGVNLASTTFTLTAPTTTGQSINYLIEATFTETDNTPVVLPYFNASNPTQPFSGPNNSGTPQNTKRAQVVSLQLKAGASANTGTQSTPAVDAGWVGLYVIQVNFAQTSITNTSISAYSNAPFLAQFLQQHHKGVPGQAPKIDLTAEVQNILPFANLPPRNFAVFSSSGTWTVPVGVTQVKVRLWGAGGGGGGSFGTGSAASGAGGGGYSEGIYTVSPGLIITVTVGAGGAPGGGTPTNGSPGGTSLFGIFTTANGGGGGFSASNGVQNTSFGAGGTATGGNLNLTGMSGGFGYQLGSSSFPSGGIGGGTYSTSCPSLSVGATGHPGQFPGGGGNGGSLGFGGGNGAGGLAILEW